MLLKISTKIQLIVYSTPRRNFNSLLFSNSLIFEFLFANFFHFTSLICKVSKSNIIYSMRVRSIRLYF